MSCREWSARSRWLRRLLPVSMNWRLPPAAASASRSPARRSPNTALSPNERAYAMLKPLICGLLLGIGFLSSAWAQESLQFEVHRRADVAPDDERRLHGAAARRGLSADGLARRGALFLCPAFCDDA